jgi:hypothetical protein
LVPITARNTLALVDERTALYEYTQGRPKTEAIEPDGIQFVSCFWLALRDARVASGRDIETGDPGPEASASIWLGAIGYLILLDQIGTAVYSKQKGLPPDEPGIHKAFFSFSDIGGTPEAEALYALRCALAHDYSLVNVPKNKNSLLRFHLFELHGDSSTPVVQLPTHPWDGNPETADSTETTTVVGIPALCDLGETMAQAVLDAYENNDLVLAIPEGPDWVRHRYQVTIRQR